MAHYAQLDENNIVINIFVGKDENEIHPEIKNWEEYYNAKRTSYNTFGGKRKNPETGELTDEPGFRKNYAGIGYTYDPARDAFIPPKPFPSWTLNEDTCWWQPPIGMPDDGNPYEWSESAGNWVLFPNIPKVD
jgi:hypothetical protein